MTELFRSITWGFGLTVGHTLAQLLGYLILFGIGIMAVLMVKRIIELWFK